VVGGGKSAVRSRGSRAALSPPAPLSPLRLQPSPHVRGVGRGGGASLAFAREGYSALEPGLSTSRRMCVMPAL